MTICITKKDIATSEALDACALTVSLRRKFGKCISVSRNYIRASNKSGSWTLILLPKNVRSAMLNTTIKPFKFVLSKEDALLLKEIKNGNL